MARSVVLVSLVLASALGAVAEPVAAQDSARTVASAQQGRNRDLPLDAARNITIDTDEGSWLSVDVSPDGKTIVFDLLGDLYTIPVGGGEATPLTSGMQFDAQPRFSPDGKTVVFTSDKDGGDNVWTIEVATKTLKQITKGKGNRYRSPEWTPDGDYIVVSDTAAGTKPSVREVLRHRNIVLCMAVACCFLTWFIVIVTFDDTPVHPLVSVTLTTNESARHTGIRLLLNPFDHV